MPAQWQSAALRGRVGTKPSNGVGLTPAGKVGRAVGLGVRLMRGVIVAVGLGSAVRVGRGVGTIGSRAALQALSQMAMNAAKSQARPRIRAS
jgi:hypothetical protein